MTTLEAQSLEDNHAGMMVTLARLGFQVVPHIMTHDKKGPGLMHMDGNGIRFEPFDGAEPLILTWEEFDNGPGVQE